MNINYTEIYQDKLIEIYSNDELDKCYVGYIINEDDTYLLINRFSNFGLNRGKMLILKETINSITTDSDYLDMIKFTMNINKDISIMKINDLELDNNKNILFDVLDKLLKEKIVVSIDLSIDDSNYLGYIKEYNEDYLIIDYFGAKSLLKINDIIAIYIDDISDRKDMLYQEWKRSK